MSARNHIGAIASLVIGATCISSPCLAGQTRMIDTSEVAEWELWGIGNVELVESKNELRLTEGKDSRGVVLLSPDTFGRDIVFRFKVRPERHEGVNVVFLSVSSATDSELLLPPGYDGSFGFWNGPDAKAQSYAFGFHTAFHQPNAFLSRNPGAKMLAQKADAATEERWYDIELHREGNGLRLVIDGETLLEATDTEEGLPPGRLGLRLRGPGDGSYSSLFKEFSIETPE